MFGLADSSPRVGRGWFLSEMYILTLRQMKQFVLAQNELAAMKREEVPEDPEARIFVQQQFDELMRHHVLIPCALGSGNQSLSATFDITVWMLRMESRNLEVVHKMLICKHLLRTV